MRTRFAPSPTGHLHLGHAYAAIFARNLAHSQGGDFFIRFEDIDITRVRDHFYQDIIEDLEWLGVSSEQPLLRQTDRQSAYLAALEQLKDIGIVYPCFCTRKSIEAELATITNAPHGPEGTHYPGTCKTLSDSEIDRILSEGSIPSWRFNATKAAQLFPNLTFTDTLHGTIDVDANLLGDTILARKDIGTSYHIAVVVDDGYQEITDVTRGEDLIHSTHIHRVLQAALQIPEPIYHHHKLIQDDDGNRLAKRHDSQSIRALRESGLTAEAVLKSCLD